MSLRKQGWDTIVPTLNDSENSSQPHWQQHQQCIAEALGRVPETRPVLWVGHSGAGFRLPVYRQAVVNPVAGYIFVDAGIPHDIPSQGLSQLDLMLREGPDVAHALQEVLAQGERFPNWTDESLQEEIPNEALRAMLLNELQPRGMRYFNEPIPVFAGWPDARCAYLHFCAAYDGDANYARRMGWPFAQIVGGHFHMIVNPQRVANALIDLVDKQLLIRSRSSSL